MTTGVHVAGKTAWEEAEFPIVAFCAGLVLFYSPVRRVKGLVPRAAELSLSSRYRPAVTAVEASLGQPLERNKEHCPECL